MAFGYHTQIFSLYKILRKTCDKKMVIASMYSNTFIVIIFGFFGIIGYMTFGA
jgi:amino acid permease